MAHDAEPDDDTSGKAATDAAGELLLVGEEFATRLIAESLEADDHQCACVDSVEAARRRVLEVHYDVILLDLDALAGRAFEVVQLAARLSPATLCVLRSRTASVESVVAAMRAGIGDYFVGTLSVPRLRLRMRAAIRRARDARGRLERVARLTSICRSLVARRGTGPANVEELAQLMGDANGNHETDHEPTAVESRGDESPLESPLTDRPPLDLCATSDAMIHAIVFDEMASQHLDAEQLVTASIEHLIGEFGALNVAVYLGTGSCRFGLAAYARADLPRASIEAELVRWSDRVCTAAAAEGRVIVFNDASSLCTHGEPAPSLGSSNMSPEVFANRAAIVVPCKHEGVCDTVFILVFQRGVPVRSSAARELEAFASTFARQLQLIQRIHTRYRPSWPPDAD